MSRKKQSTRNDQIEHAAQQYVAQFPIQRFQQALLAWFQANMRDLPWREDRDPYKVWVSEVMLQQTKVDTVVPYFNRFMQKYPSLSHLAVAEEEDVLKTWEGLGYYSRARNLHEAVKEVKEQYDGTVPDDPEQFESLKGVGPYIKGAVMSIAYGQQQPAVDGNVMRVFSRIFAIAEDIGKLRTRRLFEAIVRRLIPEDDASYFNQGIMELGSLICHPRSPQCDACPVQDVCQAYDRGLEQQLPVKQKKKKSPIHHMAAGIVIRDGFVLIRRRPAQGLLAGLYEFPNVHVATSEAGQTTKRPATKPAALASQTAIRQHMYQYYGLGTVMHDQVQSVRHTFSHLIWDIDVYVLQIVDTSAAEEQNAPDSERGKWVAVDELDDYAFPVSHQKIMHNIRRLRSH